MTEYINLELSGNNKGDDQRGNISMLPLLPKLPPLLLKLQPLLLPCYSIYNMEGKLEIS